MKKQILILLLLITEICCSQAKPLLSIKELFAEPLYYIRNDTLFTIDVYNRMQLCKDSSVVYRLKLFTGNETTLKQSPESRDMIDYTDVSIIMKRICSLPNLQYLDMNWLQLWKFPKEILLLDKLQILKLEHISREDRIKKIYRSDTIPKALWQMKNLKHLSIYLDYDEAGRPFLPYLNASDYNPETRQYIPDDVKFKVAGYLQVNNDPEIDQKIQNAWIVSRIKQQLKNIKKKDINYYSFGSLENIFGSDWLYKCECF